MSASLTTYAASAGSGRPTPSAWPPPPRAPLPPPPPGTYDRTLPFVPPSGPDLFFYRGQFCGTRVPGVPLLPDMSGYTVPGWKDNAVGSGKNPPIMSLDLTRYVARGMWDVVDEYLTVQARDGYTHHQCSVGHAVAHGLSIDQYLAYTARVKQFGFADHWFLGGAWMAQDRDRAYWAPILQPWIDALISNSLIDAACVGWQLDQFNEPGDKILSIIDYVAEQLGPHDIPIGTHWVNEAGGWWQTGGNPGNRFDWWKRMRNRVLWFHHQGDVNLPIPEYQAKLVDTLQPFGDGRMGRSGLFGDRPFSLVAYEYSAQAQFDIDQPYYQTEDQGDQRGFYLCCTKAASAVGGYGNGARRPDGSAL